MPHSYFPPHAFQSCRRAARLGVALLSLLNVSAGHAAFAGTVNWDNTPGDWFTNLTHWDNGSYPGAGDDAVNMSTAAITLGQSTTINSFFSNGAFTLTGGTFSGSQNNAASTLQVNNVFTVDGGTISNFTVNQGQGGSLVFTTSGGNGLSGDIINANVDLSAPAAFIHLYNTNTFNGTISLGAGGVNSLHLDNNTTTLALGASGRLTGFGSVAEYNGGSVFNNAGTVNASVSGQTLNISTSNFVNTGTTEVQNGAALNVTSANTGSGNLLVKQGGTATFWSSRAARRRSARVSRRLPG